MHEEHGDVAVTTFQEVADAATRSHTVLSDEVVMCLQYIFYAVICQVVAIFGLGANIINIICFLKLGFKDPINITFLGLAISDIGVLSTVIWVNICCTPAFQTSDFSFDSMELQYLTAGMPHAVFTRVTGCITAFITLERCLCITLPLKMKTIITPRRVSVITAFIFIVLIFSVTPEYVVNRLDWKFHPGRNKTIIGLVYTEDRESVAKVSYLINNVLISFGSFFVVIVCTVILVIKLNTNTKWRITSTTTSQADTISYRNQKVSQMVVIVSTLFIACFIPMCILFLGMSLHSEFSIGGKYRSLLVAVGALIVIPEALNSSVNIFIYYHMSRKFKIVFRSLFNQNTKMI